MKRLDAKARTHRIPISEVRILLRSWMRYLGMRQYQSKHQTRAVGRMYQFKDKAVGRWYQYKHRNRAVGRKYQY
jgi:hypothetical protein